MPLFRMEYRHKRSAVRETPFACRREGLTIRGTEYRPAGEDLPVAIVCHGVMATQGTVRHYARLLAGLGWAAYCFDFCGGSVAGGRSDGATTEMSVLTEVRDLEAVIAHVRALPYTGDRLLLMGCSQGGLVCALTAARHPEWVERLALFYPALCIPDDARAGQMMFACFDPEEIPETFSCGPMRLGRCYPADVMGLEPFREIWPYTGPVLLVHGTRDGVVDPDYSRRAAEGYANAQLHLIEGGGHGFGRAHDREAMDLLRDFAAL